MGIVSYSAPTNWRVIYRAGRYWLRHEVITEVEDWVSRGEAEAFCRRSGIPFPGGEAEALAGGESGEVPGADAGVHEGVPGTEEGG